jgi:hypothetical protein
MKLSIKIGIGIGVTTIVVIIVIIVILLVVMDKHTTIIPTNTFVPVPVATSTTLNVLPQPEFELLNTLSVENYAWAALDYNSEYEVGIALQKDNSGRGIIQWLNIDRKGNIKLNTNIPSTDPGNLYVAPTSFVRILYHEITDAIIAIVSGYSDINTKNGIIITYKYNGVGWGKMIDLNLPGGSQPNDGFGRSVAILKDTTTRRTLMCVGAIVSLAGNTGVVYTFEDFNDNWSQTANNLDPDVPQSAFGAVLAGGEKTLAVSNSMTSTVSIYKFIDSTLQQQYVIESSELEFGISMTMDRYAKSLVVTLNNTNDGKLLIYSLGDTSAIETDVFTSSSILFGSTIRSSADMRYIIVSATTGTTIINVDPNTNKILNSQILNVNILNSANLCTCFSPESFPCSCNNVYTSTLGFANNQIMLLCIDFNNVTTIVQFVMPQ